jgi:hypothetical protein
MSETAAHWRQRLLRSGLVLMAIEIGLYLCGIVVVKTVEPVGAKLKAAAWFFVIGTALSLSVPSQGQRIGQITENPFCGNSASEPLSFVSRICSEGAQD